MMSSVTKQAVASLALAALMGIAGCITQATPPQAKKPIASHNDVALDLNADVRPSTLNIFGEFDGRRQGAVRNAGDENFEQHTFVDEGYDTQVAVDPTGKYIVFASTRNSEHPGLYLQRVDGIAVTQLTGEDADNAFPTFSPDGKSIAFCSTRSGLWQIYTMDVDGRNVVQVTTGQMQCVHPSFSPSGQMLVFSALSGRSGQWELWTVDLTSNTKRSIGPGLFPSWSPDKSIDRIAYQKPRQRGGRWFSLWTLDLIDGEARHITEIAASTNAAVISPSWSPDGKKLAFSTIVNPNRDANGATQQDVWTINIDGSDKRRLTDGNGMNLCPAWASGDRIFFVSDRGGSECVWSAQSTAGQSAVAAANKPMALDKSDTANAEPTPAATTNMTKKTDPFESTPKQDASTADQLQDATR